MLMHLDQLSRLRVKISRRTRPHKRNHETISLPMVPRIATTRGAPVRVATRNACVEDIFENPIQPVGRTHSIVRLETKIRRKDGSENFGGCVYVRDGFPQRDFVLLVFMCPNSITVFFDSIFASILCLFCVSSTATTPRATTPHQ